MGDDAQDGLTLGKVAFRHAEDVGGRTVAARIDALNLCGSDAGHQYGDAVRKALLGHHTGVTTVFGSDDGSISVVVGDAIHFILQVLGRLVNPFQVHCHAFR